MTSINSTRLNSNPQFTFLATTIQLPLWKQDLVEQTTRPDLCRALISRSNADKQHLPASHLCSPPGGYRLIYQKREDAPNPIQHQKEKTNNAKPKPSTAALLHHVSNPTSLLPHMRPHHFLKTHHSTLSQETRTLINRQNSAQILLRALQTA